MDYTCSYCGVILAAPPPGSQPVCQNCGASQPARAGATGAPATGSWLPIADLAKLSLGQTPEAMAKVTGVPSKPTKLGKIGMRVPLSGGAWDTMAVTWDPADPSHAIAVVVFSSAAPADDAAIRERLTKLFGSRLRKDGTFLAPWNSIMVSYDASSASAMYVGGFDSDAFPRWREAQDAAWDVVRSAVLGLDVTVTDAALRDWFRGYPLSAIAELDPAIDVEHAAAAMEASFPGASPSVSRGFEVTMGVEHPVFGQIKLSWGRGKGSTLKEATLRPPLPASALASLEDLEARVQGALGKPASRRDAGTFWKPAEGGQVLVTGSGVCITLSDPPSVRSMSRDGWRKVIGVLDACVASRA